MLDAVTAGHGMCSVGPSTAALPAAADALQSVAGRPRFLDPEATRPLAAPIHRGRGVGQLPSQAELDMADAASRNSR